MIKNQSHTVLLLYIAISSAIFILWLWFSFKGGVSEHSYTVLDKMTVVVQHEDGTTDVFHNNMFNFRSIHDRITIHLPLDKSLEKGYQSINFMYYASVVRAYYKDELIVSYGDHLKRHMIGHLRVTIPVPKEAYGDEIRIEIEPHMTLLEDTFHAPILMPQTDDDFFVAIGQETSYAMLVTILVCCVFGMMITLFFYRILDFAPEGYWMFFLIFSMTLWYMGNSGLIYLLLPSEDFNAVCEYVGMYLLMGTAPIYSSFEVERPRVKRYLQTFGKFALTVGILTVIFYVLPSGYTFVDHLRWMQAFQIVMVISALFSLLFPGKKIKTTSDYIMQWGLIFVALFGLLEQTRIIAAASITEKAPLILQWFAKQRFAKVLILLMVFTFATSYFFKMAFIVQKTLEEKHLKMLAYTDNLTALGNRQYLQRKLDMLDDNRKEDYAVIFIDVNDLKVTNDIFGHDYGDKLIQMVAIAIKDAIRNATAFAGRNGGDEFICVVSPASLVEDVAKTIRNNLIEAKRQENVPFPVSIALGIATYAEVAHRMQSGGEGVALASQVIRCADERMYEDKRNQKRVRGESEIKCP